MSGDALTVGHYLAQPSMQTRRAEARALMLLSLAEYGARMRYRNLRDLPSVLRSIADELEAIGPRLAVAA